MLRQCLRHSSRAARALTCPRCQHHNVLQLFALSQATSTVQLPSYTSFRSLQTNPANPKDRIPLRKQLKQDAKSAKAQKRQRREQEEASREKWELTVGVEIHAQLNTEAKLFSSAPIIYEVLSCEGSI